MDTIAALSTPNGLGALSVVRVSGPSVRQIILKLCENSNELISSPRSQVYTKVLSQDVDNRVIDYALCAFFPGPKSFSGEDMLELSLHGSPFIIRRTLRELNLLGARHAEPGEFTRRAFLNGKLDLLQAEAIGDVIASESEAQLKAAQAQMEGKLSRAISDLGEPLKDLLAEIEAHIDFPEEDIAPDTADKWRMVIDQVILSLNGFISSFNTGRVLKEGVLVPLIGLPNAGKSSLLNALLGEERAIVTDIPGTTRDYLEERINIGGFLFRLVDTAGLADELSLGRKIDEPEALGIKRSMEFVRNSDLMLFIFDPFQERNLQLKIFRDLEAKRKILVVNKCEDRLLSDAYTKDILGFELLQVSAKNGLGLQGLREHLVAAVFGEGISSQLMISSERQSNGLISASNALERVLVAINTQENPEFISFEIRAALNHLAEIVGAVNTEDILGRIFSKFCIGK